MGRSHESIELPESVPVQQVFEHYASRYPRMRDLASSIVMAVNQQFAPAIQTVNDGDEVAFLPPVSGGSGSRYSHEIRADEGHFFGLTRAPIDAQDLKQEILQPSDGAFIIFEGVVRDNTKGRPTRFLDYECYEAMAIKVMAQIGTEIAAGYAIGKLAMVHRLGRMEIGETSVAIVVAAPHRRPAFEAALEGINRLKRLVPIWKKEHFADGEVWVEGEWDETLLRRS